MTTTIRYADFEGTPELEAIFRRALEADAQKFLTWRARQKDPAILLVHFRRWWMLHGTTAFKSVVDSNRYQGDLLLAVEARIDG